MNDNPYAAPGAALADIATDSASLEERKAHRSTRLAAAILDGLAFGGVLVGVAFLAGLVAPKNQALLGGMVFLAFALMIAINVVLLARAGQTIGKKALGISIVRTDGSRASVPRLIFLRYVPLRLLGAIPYLGAILTLLDSVWIFGGERRCLHDLIADTIVVKL